MGILLIIGIILLVLWLLGLFVFSLGGLIHIALVIAVIFISCVWSGARVCASVCFSSARQRLFPGRGGR